MNTTVFQNSLDNLVIMSYNTSDNSDTSLLLV